MVSIRIGENRKVAVVNRNNKHEIKMSKESKLKVNLFNLP